MGLVRNGVRISLLAAVAISALAIATPASAQNGQRQEYNVEAGDLGAALRTVSRLSGREIIFGAEAVKGKHAPRLRGTYSADEAVRALLEGSDLAAEFRKDVILIRGRSEASGEVADRPADQQDIVVTGSHIRGSEPTSPVISATREEIKRRGRTDLGSFARDLPQNFSGGQNPGLVGGGVQGGNENLNSSSSLNLRGLGPDATLTLINGHRVAYDGVLQGVDISAIPLAAVERVEIVADGASALYGSDAVAGVANIILRRNFDGLWTSARAGTSTDGGNTQQQYSAVAGKTWQSGGLLVTLDYSRSTEVRAGQRSYAESVNESATLIPRQRQISAMISGHQRLADSISLDLDAQYSNRTSSISLPTFTTTDVFTNGVVTEPQVRAYSITPTLRFQLPASWALAISGTHGSSATLVPGATYSNGQVSSRRHVRYENGIDSIEAYADGPVLSLPGGTARLAVGIGYRSISLDANTSETTETSVTPILVFNRRRNVKYGFGEISVPLVGASNQRSLVKELQLTGAIRYEDYNGIGNVASPKFGIIYKPDDSVAVKASWGQSFKAPTLYDQFRPYQAVLLPASFFGPSSAGIDSTVLYLAGGNPALNPEKATTWSVSIQFEPKFIPGLKLEASYFNIHYKDRVGTPITSIFGVFSNPIYSHLIDLQPTGGKIDAVASGAVFGLENFTDRPYDPSQVFAIVNNNLQNSAQQAIQGIDLSARYGFDLSSRDHFIIDASASYLKSDRQLVAGLPTSQNAGVVFKPPHWRANGGGTWERDSFSLSTFANYIGGTLDNRAPPFATVSSFLAIDIVAQLRSRAASGAFKDVQLIFSVLNAFNERPSRIRSSSSADPSFDSTNYPSTGRTISFTVSKSW